MSPILSLLLGLTALIPQALSLPATPANGLPHIINVHPPVNPLPPLPPGCYPIPGTRLSITIVGRTDLPPLPSSSALACLTAAHNDILATIDSLGRDLPLPRPSWRFVESNILLTASPVFAHLGTYSQLAIALTGLRYVITEPRGPGVRELEWILGHEVMGLVMRGSIGPRPAVGVGSGLNSTETATATATVTATATPSFSITAVRELDISRANGMAEER